MSSSWMLCLCVQVGDEESREQLIKTHYMARVGELTTQLQISDSKAVHFHSEVNQPQLPTPQTHTDTLTLESFIQAFSPQVILQFWQSTIKILQVFCWLFEAFPPSLPFLVPCINLHFDLFCKELLLYISLFSTCKKKKTVLSPPPSKHYHFHLK